VDVQPVRLNLTHRFLPAESRLRERIAREHLENAEHLRRKGLVHVDHADVRELHARAIEGLGHRERRTDQELVGWVDAHVGPTPECCERLQPESLGPRLLHQQHGGGAVRESARVAGSESSVFCEGRPQLLELLDAGVASDDSVGAHGLAVRELDRHDLGREPTG
jgi:hypothetical protein